MDVDVGTQLGVYRLESLVGRGGMGSVYLARQEFPNRAVAIKVIGPDLAGNERFRQRFIRESNAAAAIGHPHVIPIYEASESGGALYIVMPYIPGSDLGRLIHSEGPLSADTVVAIARQIGGALDALHGHDLVHRDVKPANILVARSGPPGTLHCYLSDFGLSVPPLAPGSSSGSSHAVGTLDYMAPEQIEGGPVDARADVYSLGCVLFEALTGRPPYQRESLVGLMYAHLHDPPPPAHELRPELPAAVDAVLDKALAKPKEDRYPTCAAMVADLEQALQPEPQVQPQPELPTEPPARPRRRRRIPASRWVAVAAAVAVLAAAVVAIVLRNQPSAPPVDPGPSEVYVISSDGGTPLDVSANSADEAGAMWSPVADRLTFISSRFSNVDTYAVDADGKNLLRLTFGPGQDRAAAWSPNGLSFVYMNDMSGSDEIYGMTSTGFSVRRLTTNEALDSVPQFSPDGKRVVFVSDRTGNKEIWVMNRDGSDQTQLTHSPGDETSPKWSPAGGLIAYGSDRDGDLEIYTIAPNGSGERRLTDSIGADSQWAWSANGSRLAFSSDRDGNFDIFVMNADGTNQTPLTHDPGNDRWPAWSPDGRKIAFVSDRSGMDQLYVMNSDGSGVVRLTDSTLPVEAPAWSFDGAYIAYDVGRKR